MSVSFSGVLGSEWTTVFGPPELPTRTNFTGDALPTTSTDVIIGQPGTLAPTVSISQQNYQSVYSSVRVGARNLEVFGGGTLNANASLMTIAGNITNLGNLNVNTDLVTVNGNILNDGLLTISAESVGGNNSSVLRLEGTTSLTGTGNLRLIGSGTQRDATDISAELTGAFPTGISFLENASRISGQGIIGFNGNSGDPGGVLVLHNLATGIIDANRTTGTLTLFNTGVTAANPTTNAGTLMATAGGRLDIRSQVVEQSPLGVILANGAGSRVDLWDTTVRGGLVASSSGGLIQSTNSATELDGSTSFGSVVLSVGTVFDVGVRTTLKGAVVNQGTIRQNGYNGLMLIGTEGVTLTGGGEIAMSFDGLAGGLDSRLMGVSETATATLTNVDNHIRGAGTIGKYNLGGFQNDLMLVNQAGGRISADFAGQKLNLQGLISVANAGTMRAINGATLAIQNLAVDGSSEDAMTVLNPGGTILADGAGSRILLSGFNGAANEGRLTITGGTLAGINGGEVIFNGQTVTYLDGSTNQGAVTLQGIFRVETSGTFRGEIRNEGQILFRDNAESTLVIAKEGASLTRNGTVSMVGDRIMGEAQSTYDFQTNTPLDPAPALLTNANATIQGSGTIGPSPSGTIQNRLSLVNGADGVIRANIAPVGLNSNILTVATGYTVVNNGLIEADGGILRLLDQVTTGGQLRVKNGGALILQAGVADDVDFVGATAEVVRFVSDTATPNGLGNQSGAFNLNYGGTLRGMSVGDTVYTHTQPSIGNPESFDLNGFGWSKEGDIGVLSYRKLGFWDAGQETAVWRIAGVERSQIELVTDGVLANNSQLFGFRRVATTDGDGGANRIVGTEGKDRLLGLGGDDTLVGAGADAVDILDGGEGNDTADYSAYQQGFVGFDGKRVGVSVFLAPDALLDNTVGKDASKPHRDILRSIENVIGTNFADTFDSAGAYANRFDGMGGNDYFSSNGGDDTFNGGEGSDWFALGQLPNGNFSFAFNAAGDGVFQAANGRLTYTSMEGIQGGVTEGDINVIGNASANRLNLSTGKGNILIDGQGGNDSIVGSHFGSFDVPAAILLRGGDGGDSIIGSGRADTLIGDGTRLTTPEENAIRRLYLATLNRGPDEAGWSDWTGQLLGGRPLNDIAEGFVGSQEFQRVYGPLDNTGFVTLLYNNVLKRAPDAGGLAAYVGALDAGLTRKEVVTGFSQSPEFRTTTSPDTHAGQVYRLYGATLARAPDAGGFETWTDTLGGGRSLVDIAAGFVNSTEFQQRYGALDTAGFVTLLYQNVLGRAADTGGLAYWTGQLGSGAQSRTQVVIGFSESAEYIAGTRPGADGFMRTVMTNWNDTIEGGGGDDLASGGRGSDRFVFSAFSIGNDTVYGFDSYDTLELKGLGFADPAAALAAVTQQGPNAVLAYSGGSITFVETDVSVLRALSAQGWVLG